MAASKKGISAHQLHRVLEITYKAAWFMCRRIREAMREEHPIPLGGPGKIVEADEAYHGKRETPVQLSRGMSETKCYLWYLYHSVRIVL